MNTLYMHFSNCIVVKGYSRSLIYDLQRIRHLSVTNYFADLLISNSYKIPFNSSDEDLKAFLNVLVEDEWGVYIDSEVSNIFPELDLTWDSYSKITSAQIDLNNDSQDILLFFQKTLPQLEKLVCKDIEISFIEPIQLNRIEEFLELFNNTTINSINLFLPYIESINFELSCLFDKQPRLNMIFFYSAPFIKYENNNFVKIRYTSNSLVERFGHKILPEYFTTNIYMFSEAQKFNTYFNRKIYVDCYGNIKNSIPHGIIYGNISNTQIEDAIQEEGFKDLWDVNKDKIDVCKDCEFRYMCIDSAILNKRIDATWYRSEECNYNPYICKWEHEEGYRTLQECGVIVNSEVFEIDHQQVEKLNKLIWGEE